MTTAPRDTEATPAAPSIAAPPDRRLTEAIAELEQLLGAARVSQGDADRLTYSRDMWPRTLLAVRDGVPAVAPPDLVVWPASTSEVSAVVRIARRHRLPIVPYGAGSGVCGGAMATRGGIIVDLKRMDRVLEVVTADHLVHAECGIIGQLFEEQLNRRGMTLGHFPSSIYCSTLGGWLAARSAGQLSSLYGKIEDMVERIEVVLGDGRVVELSRDQMPDLGALMVGSEGTLGVITRAWMRVRPLRDFRIFRAYRFPRVAAGCEAMRRIMQRELRPAVTRLYDEMDTLMARPSKHDRPDESSLLGGAGALLGGVDADVQRSVVRAALSRAGMLSKVAESLLPRISSGCLMVLGFEGDRALTEVEAALAHAEALAAGGEDLGQGPGLHWWDRRYAVSYKMSPMFAAGALVDTMEIATTWDRLLELYDEVRKALSRDAVVLAHFSHAYAEGCSIYFTFAAAAKDRASSEALYDELWRRGLDATTRVGATISHHHGVGLSKAAFMSREHGEALSVYRQAKHALDPDGVLNPGKMGL
ncbi:MAG: FAD-binding oxidoreductase [Myxococcales bacterium]|nr:FAD-binding oxidoreductase [Myxococcales bacterium]